MAGSDGTPTETRKTNPYYQVLQDLKNKFPQEVNADVKKIIEESGLKEYEKIYGSPTPTVAVRSEEGTNPVTTTKYEPEDEEKGAYFKIPTWAQRDANAALKKQIKEKEKGLPTGK